MQTQEIALLGAGSLGADPQLSTGSILALLGVVGIVGFAVYAGTKAKHESRRRKHGFLGRAAVRLLGGHRPCRGKSGRFKRGC